MPRHRPPGMMVSEDRDIKLARLSDPDLVAHLGATWRRADYDAASRVLGARDCRLAEAEAALAEVRPTLAAALEEVDALRRSYIALEAARRSETAAHQVRDVAIAVPAPAPREEWRAVGTQEKGGDFIDLCSSDDEEGVEEADAAGVSSERKPSASGEEEGRRADVAGISCKRKAYASSSSSSDVLIPLNQLWKKRREAEPGVDGEPEKGNGDVVANSIRPSGNDLPKTPEARVRGSEDPKVTAFVQEGRGNGKLAEDGSVSKKMPSSLAPGFPFRSSSQKAFTKVDHGGAGIAEKEGSFASLEEDTPSQVRTPSITTRKIVESARGGAQPPLAHTGSALGETGSAVSGLEEWCGSEDKGVARN